MGQVVTRLDRGSADALRDALVEAGFEMRTIQHAVFAAAGPGVSIAYYKQPSNKVVIGDIPIHRTMPGVIAPSPRARRSQ